MMRAACSARSAARDRLTSLRSSESIWPSVSAVAIERTASPPKSAWKRMPKTAVPSAGKPADTSVNQLPYLLTKSEPTASPISVATDTRKDHRAEGVLEAETAEVQSWRVGDDSTELDGPAVVAEDRQPDPVEDLLEARAPDDVGDVDDRPVVEDRPAVVDSGQLGLGAFDTALGKVGTLDP